MKVMLQTRRRRFVLYALTITAGMLVSCVILGLIGYSSNQKLPSGPEITSQMSALDKTRLAEALHLKAELGDQIWPGYANLEAPVIIWNDAYEFIFRVDQPPMGWETIPNDTFDGRPYYRRPADDPQNFAVQVDDGWAASIFTKQLVDMGLISAIKGLLPPVIADIFPYQIIIQPSELQISAVQHEYFHVVQAELASQKFALADQAYKQTDRYWEMDPVMQAAWRTEIDTLIEALNASTDGDAAELVRQFLTLRDQRRREFGVDAELVSYEQLVEWMEGTAKYVEMRSWQEASTNPGYAYLAQMDADPDFKGYKTFESRWNQEISQAKRQASQEGDVRFYYTGMLQAFLLDRLLADWKDRIMAEGVFLEDLLREAVTR